MPVGGDMAKQRMEEAWAAKRKVSEKETGESGVPFGGLLPWSLVRDKAVRGIVALKPCRTRS